MIMEYHQQPVGATRALFAKAHWRRGRRSDSGKICKNLQWVFIFWSSLLASSWCREFTLLGQRKEKIIVFSSFRLMHEPSFASKNAVIYEKKHLTIKIIKHKLSLTPAGKNMLLLLVTQLQWKYMAIGQTGHFWEQDLHTSKHLKGCLKQFVRM